MINAFWRILFGLTCPKKCVQLSSFKCWWYPWRHMRGSVEKKRSWLVVKISPFLYGLCKGASRENINVKSYDLLRPWCQEHNSSLTFFKAQTMCHLGRVLLDHQCLFRRWASLKKIASLLCASFMCSIFCIDADWRSNTKALSKAIKISANSVATT